MPFVVVLVVLLVAVGEGQQVVEDGERRSRTLLGERSGHASGEDKGNGDSLERREELHDDDVEEKRKCFMK